MRTDYILYIVAVICFIIAGYSAAAPFTEFMANALIAIVLAAIGIIFIWGGYSLRPSTSVLTRAEPVMPLTKPAMAEEPPTMAPPPPEPEPESAFTPAPEPETTPAVASMPETTTPMPEPEQTEETSQPEPAPPQTKPVRKRRERKKT